MQHACHVCKGSQKQNSKQGGKESGARIREDGDRCGQHIKNNLFFKDFLLRKSSPYPSLLPVFTWQVFMAQLLISRTGWASQTAWLRRLCSCSKVGADLAVDRWWSIDWQVLIKQLICIDHWERLSYVSLLFFGTVHSDAYIFPFLLCFLLLFFSELFASSWSPVNKHFTFPSVRNTLPGWLLPCTLKGPHLVWGPWLSASATACELPPCVHNCQTAHCLGLCLQLILT